MRWSIDHGTPGPTTVLIACMHGNEPAAAHALDRIRDQIEAAGAPVAGRIVALTGNTRATDLEQRYVDDDLNRLFQFTPAPQPHLHLAADVESVEHREAIELLATLQKIIDERCVAEPVYVIDLHTFSGDGGPFLVMSDTLRNRTLARCWPVPIVLGLAELLEGTLIDYLTACGCVCAVIETGRHDDPRSTDLHEAALRLALVHVGHVGERALTIDRLADERALIDAARGAPNVVDVQDRHDIRPGVLFEMRPGYENFHAVQRGEHLADSNGEPVYARVAGRILLPLYQEQGDDGFFIARPIGRIWLRLSGMLRRVGVSRLISLMPGVRRHPELSGALLVDRNIARWLAVDVFHLLGYRLVRKRDDELVVSQHAWDMTAPDEIRVLSSSDLADQPIAERAQA